MEQAADYLTQLNDFICSKIIANPETKLNDLNLELDTFEYKPKN